MLKNYLLDLLHSIVEYDDDVFSNLVFRFFLSKQKKINNNRLNFEWKDFLPEESIDVTSLFPLRKPIRGLFDPGILIVVR